MHNLTKHFTETLRWDGIAMTYLETSFAFSIDVKYDVDVYVDVDFFLFFLIYFFGLDTKYPIASPPEIFFLQILKIDQTFHVSISDTIRLTNS